MGGFFLLRVASALTPARLYYQGFLDESLTLGPTAVNFGLEGAFLVKPCVLGHKALLTKFELESLDVQLIEPGEFYLRRIFIPHFG